MKSIAITGATGLIGRAIVRDLLGAGVHVIALTRDPSRASFGRAEVRRFDPNESANPVAFAGADAVVHLAGESVAGRWNEPKKQRIYDSRVIGTRNVVASIAALKARPSAFVCASATGYYGDRASEPLTEEAAPGRDFLARVCTDWERETQSAQALGVRVACIRTGIVLSPRGGALAQMIVPFRLGLGGPFGSGKQFVPWIHLDDLVRLYIFAIEDVSASGPINAVAPNEITNSQFASSLGRTLHRPAILPAPPFALRAVLGEFADSILASQRVIPKAATASGFTWQYTDIDGALLAALN